MAVAAELGLDLERLRSDMQHQSVEAEIARNVQLAHALRINGTPGFVVGEEILRGATDLPTMEKLIERARNGQTN